MEYINILEYVDYKVNNIEAIDSTTPPIYNGSIDIYPFLNKIVNKYTTNGCIIFFPATTNGATYLLGTDITIPATITLKFASQSKIKIDSGVTLTLNGDVEAGKWKVFDIDGTLAGTPQTEECYADWFGVTADADYYDSNMWYSDAGFTTQATDNQPILEMICNLFKVVLLSSGNYYVSGQVEIDRGVTYFELRGIGDVNIYTPASQQASVYLFTTGADRSKFENLYFESKNLYAPWIGGGEQAGLTSNITAIHSHYSGNITLENIRTQNCSSGFSKSNFNYDTSNYYINNCVFLDTTVGIYFQKGTNFYITNTKITTADTGIDLFCHCIYMGADVRHVHITNCDLEVVADAIGTEDCGSIIKFSYNPTTYPTSTIEDLHISNCTCKTASTQGMELSSIDRAFISECHFEFTKTTAYTNKLVVLSLVASEGIVFDNCTIEAEFVQEMCEDLSGSWSSEVNPVVFRNCDFTLKNYNASLFPSLVSNKTYQEFYNCDFLHTGGGLNTLFRMSSTKKVKFFGCKGDSTNNTCNWFNLGANADVEMYNCVLNNNASRDLVTTLTSGASMIAIGNIFKNCTRLNATKFAVDIDNTYEDIGHTVKSFDPASLTAGSGETTTVTVTGAELGDFAIASFSLAQSDVLLNAWVSTTNEVSVRFQNQTTGTVDLGAGILRVKVLKGASTS